MPDDDGNWTIVVGRKASKVHSCSSVNANRFRGSHVPRLGEKAAPKEPLVTESPAQQCDESLLLLKVKRSSARVEQSAFFKKFLDQVHSPSIFTHIHRIASQSPVENEGKLSSPSPKFAPPPKFTCDSGDGLDLEIRSSKVRVCESENIKLKCRSTEVSAVRMRSFKSDETASESSAAFMSKSVGVGCGGMYCRQMTCSCMVKLCGDKKGCDGEWKCRSVRVSLRTTSSESKKCLTGSEEESCYQMGDKRPCVQIIAYGLGSIADSEVSRCQLALILLMKERLEWVGDVHVYDPVLSEYEHKVIRGLGCSSITINEEGRRSICGPTIFYMPHCEDWLYNNVLQANWMPQKLNQLVILGNSFRCYKDRWSSLIGVRSKKPPPAYVLEFQQVAEEISLEATASLELPAFNNMSWHFYQQPLAKTSSFLKF